MVKGKVWADSGWLYHGFCNRRTCSMWLGVKGKRMKEVKGEMKAGKGKDAKQKWQRERVEEEGSRVRGKPCTGLAAEH